MDSAPRYYGRWIKTAFAGPFLIADGVAGLISMLGGLAVYMEWIPTKAAALAAIFIPLGILLIGVGAQVILAPYRMHRRDHEGGAQENTRETLRHLYREGDRLSHQGELDHPAGPEAWRSDFKKWTSDVEECLRELYSAKAAEEFRQITPHASLPEDSDPGSDEMMKRAYLLINRLAYIYKLLD